MLPASLQVQVRSEHLLKRKHTTAQPGLQQRRIHADEELQNLVRQSGHVGTLLKGWLQTSASPSLDMPGHRAVMWLTCFPRPCKCTLVGNSCSSSITNTTAQPGLQQRRIQMRSYKILCGRADMRALCSRAGLKRRLVLLLTCLAVMSLTCFPCPCKYRFVGSICSSASTQPRSQASSKEDSLLMRSYKILCGRAYMWALCSRAGFKRRRVLPLTCPAIVR